MVTGYIIDKVDSKYITFKYYQGLSNSVSAEYNDQGIFGRSEPHSVYSKTGPDTFQFNLILTTGEEEGDTGTTDELWADYLFLKSFQFPDYGNLKDGPIKPPHNVIIRIGNFFRKEGEIRSPVFDLDSPTDSRGYPYIIKATFTFRVVHKIPVDINDIRNNL